MSDLAQVQISPIFHDLGHRLHRLQDQILRDAKPIIKREYTLSVRQRFFRIGAGLASTEEKFITEGDRRSYQLSPSLFYMIFGEFGTGRRGALTGPPAPSGYRYGPRAGMAARRFGRIALSLAKPQITDAARVRVKQFALNATT